jgi:hypothetical protein
LDILHEHGKLGEFFVNREMHPQIAPCFFAYTDAVHHPVKPIDVSVKEMRDDGLRSTNKIKGNGQSEETNNWFILRPNYISGRFHRLCDPESPGVRRPAS